MAEEEGISCEIIDLQTLYPYDLETLVKLMKQTLKRWNDYSILRKDGRDAVIKNHSHNCAITKWEALINHFE